MMNPTVQETCLGELPARFEPDSGTAVRAS
jgi:hypothetical protein